jgi:hypothetical protein
LIFASGRSSNVKISFAKSIQNLANICPSYEKYLY